MSIIALFAGTVPESPDAVYVLKYGITFLHAYQTWSDLCRMCNSYYMNDGLQRTLILIVMGIMTIFANNVFNIFDKDSPGKISYYTSVTFFQLVHLLIIITFMVYSFYITVHLVRMRILGIANTMSFICSHVLFFFSGWQGRTFPAILALATEHACWFAVQSPFVNRQIYTKFLNAVNIEHEKDRMTAL